MDESQEFLETEVPVLVESEAVQETSADYEAILLGLEAEIMKLQDDVKEQNVIIQQQADLLSSINTYEGYISGFMLFFVICILCLFAYKFFRIFF